VNGVCGFLRVFFGVEGGDREGEGDIERQEKAWANCAICASPPDIRPGSAERSCFLSRLLRNFSMCRLSSGISYGYEVGEYGRNASAAS
jgi:hypothetical protein